MGLKLELFARLRLSIDEQPITAHLRPRAQRLLAYLLLQRQAPRPRPEIAYKLWPDRAEKEALGALRRALSELRAALPEQPGVEWIVGTYDALEWNFQAPFWLDIMAFEQLIQEGTPVALHDAISLYTGDLLLSFDDEWVHVERERLRYLLLQTLRQLIAHYRALGQFDAALNLARRALGHDPLAEAVYRDLIAIHYEAGDRAAALTEYKRLRALLHEELGVEPMPETEALREAITRGAPLPAPEEMIGGRPLVQPPPTQLFGREAEFAELVNLWAETAAGQGHCVLVSGEAGVGKSHLALSLAEFVTRQEGLVLTGHCLEFEHALPYQAIIDMLRPARNLLRHSNLDPAYRAPLARLAPDVLGVAGDGPDESGASSKELRQQLFESLFQAFLALSRSQPLLLIVEDAHWAAESTLDWLTYIIPRLSPSRLFVLITYRTHEDKDLVLARLGRRFAREGNVSPFPLQPLSQEANRQLVAHLSALDQEKVAPLADRLFVETGGNPFFLHELVRGLIEAGQIEASGGQWKGAFIEAAPGAQILLPDSLRETISARVGHLLEMSRMFLRMAAIAGRVFEYEVVRQAGGWAEEQALEALEDLLARGFLKTSETAGIFAFSHHLVREAVASELTGPRRARLHRLLAKAIQQSRPGDYEALAHHFIAAGENEAAVEYTTLAARRAEDMYAYEEAVQHLLTALKLLEGQDRVEVHLALLEELADDYRLLRQGAQAISFYQAALALWQSSAGAYRTIAVRLHRKILQTTAGMWGRAGFEQFEAASQISLALRKGLARVLTLIKDDPPHPETVRLLKALANDALVIRNPPDWDKARNYALEAVAMAEHLDAPVELSAALSTLASVYGSRGMLRQRVEVSQRRLAISHDPRFDDLRERLRTLTGLGSALVHVGEYHQAIPYLQEAEKLAGQVRAVDLQSQALSLLHQCWFRLDRWDEMRINEEKRQWLRERYSLERLGSPCFAIALSSAVHALRGEFEPAERLRQDSITIMFGIGGPPKEWRRSQHY